MFDAINIIITSLVIIIILLLGGLSLKNNKDNITNKLFFFFAIGLAVWEIFSFLENYLYLGPKLMFLSLKLDFFFAPYVVFFASLFVFNFPQKNQRINRLIPVLSMPIILISALSFSNLIIDKITIAGGAIEFSLGKLFFLYAVVFLTYIISGFINLFFKYSQSSKLEKKQIVYILFGFAFTLIITTVINLFLQNRLSVEWFRISNLIPPLILALSMFRVIALYKLLDIKLIMRRYFVYLLSVLSVIIPIAAWLYFFEIFPPRYLTWIYLLLFDSRFSRFFQIKKILL